MTQMDFYPYPNFFDSYTRLIIFLVFSVCVGLAALFWASHFLLFHTGRISAFIPFLLFSDLCQLILNAIMAIFPYLSENLFFQFWTSLNLWGFVLHQLVALDGILTLKDPAFSACIFSLPCSIFIIILVIVLYILNVFIISMRLVHTFSSLSFSLGKTVACLILLAVSFTFTCKAPPTPVFRNKHLVFAVAMVTFVLLYLPFMLVICLSFFVKVDSSPVVMSVCLMSLRVISDPLLCVLVCRENLRHQKHTKPNSDETAG